MDVVVLHPVLNCVYRQDCHEFSLIRCLEDCGVLNAPPSPQVTLQGGTWSFGNLTGLRQLDVTMAY